MKFRFDMVVVKFKNEEEFGQLSKFMADHNYEVHLYEHLKDNTFAMLWPNNKVAHIRDPKFIKENKKAIQKQYATPADFIKAYKFYTEGPGPDEEYWICNLAWSPLLRHNRVSDRLIADPKRRGMLVQNNWFISEADCLELTTMIEAFLNVDYEEEEKEKQAND